MSKMIAISVIITVMLGIFMTVDTMKSLCPKNFYCTCPNATNKIGVFCQGVKHLTVVRDVIVNDLKSKPVRTVKIKRCIARYLNSTIFLNLTIKELRIQCPLNVIDDEAFEQIDSLTKLKLSLTFLQKIPRAISRAKGLKDFAIQGDKLDKIGNELQNMTQLKKLSLKRNRIKSISKDAFLGDENLKSITLESNKLKNLDPGIFDLCPNLEKVSLEDNHLKTVDGLFKNPSLKKINLKRNELTSLQNAFHNIKSHHSTTSRVNIIEELKLNVEELNLNDNINLTYISDIALGFSFKYLRRLFLRNCGLIKVSDTFLRPFSHLEVVDLSHNFLKIIPEGFFYDLEDLIEVNLGDNRITSVRNCFRQNNYLKYINLEKNLIAFWGNAFSSLPSLKVINLYDNNLVMIVNTDFLQNPSLEELNLSKNSITRIDSDAFSHLKQLREINLSDNELKIANGSFQNIPNLRTLKLHNNNLEKLTEQDFFGTYRLQVLNLAENNLRNLRGVFKYSYSLETLSIRKNKLETLSRESFPNTLKIREIFSSGNRWICDCRLLWVKDFIQETKIRGSDHDFNCSEPSSFKSKMLGELTTKDLVSWPKEDCPIPCDCSCVADDDIRYVRVDCSSKRLRKLPNLIGELDLQGNDISNPVEFNLPPTATLRILNLERNLISQLNVNFSIHIPNIIEVLQLAENNITRFFDYPPTNVKRFTLSQNPWNCDCNTLDFRKWMIAQNSKVLDANATSCSDTVGKESLRKKIITTLSEIELCPELLRNYILMGAGGFVILTMTVASFVVHLRYRYHVRVWLYSRGMRCLKKGRDRRDVGKLYDAYISFSDEDADMVKKHFLLELEGKPPFYSLYVPQRDLKTGVFEISHLMERVMDSKRTVILLTEHYLKNEFCMEIFRVAFANSLEEKLYRIILVEFAPLPPLNEIDQSLKIVMDSSRCLKFGEKLFWDMLRYEMPEKRPTTSNDYELLDDANCAEDVPLIQEF